MAIEKVKAVIFDKDGTLVPNVPYNVDLEVVKLMPGVKKGLLSLKDRGWKLVIASNQSGVARGYFGEEKLAGVWQRLEELTGVTFDAVYYCPHGPDDNCTCRKPHPGMLMRAADEMGLDLLASWMVGDSENDEAAGKAAGCRTVIIGKDAADFMEAVNIILTREV